MSSFKDAVQEGLNSVFLNLDEFAETHTVYYDGEEYSDIPIVMTGPVSYTHLTLPTT